MKKLFLFLIPFCLPVFSFGQSQFQGFYQAQFFNIFGDVKIIRADFEVKADNTIVGKIDSGGAIKAFQGQTTKEKFEARTPMENDVVTIIKGEFPNGKKEGKISLVWRTEQKGNGSKSVSENGITGFIKQIPAPVELKDVGIIDNGKTQLWFQHAKPFFGKEWMDAPTFVKISNIVGRAVEIQLRSPEMIDSLPARYFKLRLNFHQPDQKVWTGNDFALISYAEENNKEINLFTSGNGATSGQVELISENENEIIFKITNLKIKSLDDESFVQIDGYVHAVKNKS